MAEFAEEDHQNLILFTIKWKSSSFSLPPLCINSVSVLELKEIIENFTSISPSNQKLLGLCKGIKLADEALLASLDLKLKGNLCSISLMGTPDVELEAFASASFASSSSSSLSNLIINDFGLHNLGHSHSKVWSKLVKHTTEVQIHFINAPRPGSRLLVLDLGKEVEVPGYIEIRTNFNSPTNNKFNTTHPPIHSPTDHTLLDFSSTEEISPQEMKR